MEEIGQVQPKRSGWAIASLVFGICFFIPLAFLLAIIFGIVGLVKISKSKGALIGQTMAIVGLVLGGLQILLIPIIALLSAIAIPNFVRARETAQASACVANLETIDTAKNMYALENGLRTGDSIPLADNNGVNDGDSIPDVLEPYVEGELICPAGGTYTVDAVGISPTCSLGDQETERTSDDHVLP